MAAAPFGKAPTIRRPAVKDRRSNDPRSSVPGAPAAPPYGVATPEGLAEAIEAERANLAKAEAILGCLVIALEYADAEASAPCYPDVVRLARDVVRQSINGLDPLALQNRLTRNRVKDEAVAAWGRWALARGDLAPGNDPRFRPSDAA